jgi:hypothetical protein
MTTWKLAFSKNLPNSVAPNNLKYVSAFKNKAGTTSSM